jgi:hypothetical protein
MIEIYVRIQYFSLILWKPHQKRKSILKIKAALLKLTLRRGLLVA